MHSFVMPCSKRLVLVVLISAFGPLEFSCVTAQAQSAPTLDRPVPPRLSFQRSQYLDRHPSERAALMAGLPPHRTHPPRAAPDVAKVRPVVDGAWTTLGSDFPGSFGASAPQLMMDGTLLVHDYCTPDWYKLTPDQTGGYVDGTWTKVASMASGYTPLYFASQVLADGRLIVNGGEYNEGCAQGTASWTSLGAIYNPVTNKWKPFPAPSGWTQIGDAQSVVLFNEKYMLADCCESSSSGGGFQAIWNPTTAIGKWVTTGADKADENDEEGWSLLPDGNLITADAYSAGSCGMNTELYDKKTGTWSSAGNSPILLSDCVGGSYELGPQLLRPDGTVVMFSGVANGPAAGTVVYNSTTGTITRGATTPQVGGVNYTLADAPAALEPNGALLFAASPSKEGFPTPSHFFEYSTANVARQITNDPTGASFNASYVYNLLLLPTGQILETDETDTVQIFTPIGSAPSGVAPVITTVGKNLKRGMTRKVAGTQLNGLSEAGAYGDDEQAATDYPIFRIQNLATGHVFYGRTTSQSSRDIAPGAATTATFVVPESAEVGPSTLTAVTNGVGSAAVNVTVK